MKKKLLSLIAVVVMFTQPALAGSSKEGGEKQPQKETQGPTAQPNLGEMPTHSQVDLQVVALAATNVAVDIAVNPKLVNSPTPTESKKLEKSAQKLQKVKILDKTRTHGVSSTFGILSLVLGVLGFVFAWFLWPLGLALAICAVIFGIIGLLGGRSGRGMAIVGIILGIITILLPVLIISLFMTL